MPLAYISVANGFLAAANGVTPSLIVGTQNFVAALLTLNLGNTVNAALDGTKNVLVAMGQGAGAIVDGIEAAQFGIATALATTPPPPPAFAADATNVAALRTFSVDNTVSLDRTSAKSAPDSETTSEQERTATEHKGTADRVASGAVVTGVPPVVEDQKPVVTEVDSRGAVTGPPVATTPTSPKDAVKLPEKAVDSGKATGVEAPAKPAAPKNDHGAGAKAASGGEAGAA